MLVISRKMMYIRLRIHVKRTTITRKKKHMVIRTIDLSLGITIVPIVSRAILDLNNTNITSKSSFRTMSCKFAIID